MNKITLSNLLFRVAFVFCLFMATHLDVSHASIAINDARATANYWTQKNPTGDMIYLSPEEIKSINREMLERNDSLTDLKNYPSSLTAPALKEMILSAQQDFRGETSPGEHYDKGGSPITLADYQKAQNNCNLAKLPANIVPQYAVITQRTDLRLLPTPKFYFDDPSFQHYDDLQGTALDPCEPALLLHKSADGAFAFVVTRSYKGWVSLGALGVTDKTTWEKYAVPQEFLVVTANKKRINIGGAWSVLFQMGSTIPLKDTEKKNGAYTGILPVEVNGHLSEKEVAISADDTIHLGFLPCTANNFTRQSLKFLGDVYGWGGMEDSVDCSSFVQDVYRSMGIEIPRDADQQELALPKHFKLDGLNTSARYQKVKEAPVGALLFKPGHVMLYLGQDEKGTPLAIHSASSYFTFSGGKGKKHYIRQVLVSDLTYQNGKGIQTINGMTSVGFLK